MQKQGRATPLPLSHPFAPPQEQGVVGVLGGDLLSQGRWPPPAREPPPARTEKKSKLGEAPSETGQGGSEAPPGRPPPPHPDHLCPRDGSRPGNPGCHARVCTPLFIVGPTRRQAKQTRPRLPPPAAITGAGGGQEGRGDAEGWGQCGGGCTHGCCLGGGVGTRHLPAVARRVPAWHGGGKRHRQWDHAAFG